jgi:hypothetical protein
MSKEISFNSTELRVLAKLLHKLKYENIDDFEFNQFTNSPILNDIIVKIENLRFPNGSPKHANPNVKEFCFEFDNYVGVAIRKKLEVMDIHSFKAINEFDKNTMESFVKDILGSVKYDKEESDKLCSYLIELTKEKLK